MLNIKNKNIYAQPIEIAGEVYPAILSMKAIHDIEETLQEDFESVLNNLYSITPVENGQQVEFDTECFSAVLLSCLEAANENIDKEKLIDCISKSDCFDIGIKLTELLNEQLPVNVAEYKRQEAAPKAEENGLDWRNMMYFTTAHLHWTPEQFWNSTFFMYAAMLEQHLIYNGIKGSTVERNVAKNYEELMENMRMIR